MRHSIIRYILATLFIAFGVLLILENIGIGSFNVKQAWVLIYPILFVVYGLISIIKRIQFREGSWGFGSFILIFGTLLLLDRFDLILFHFKDVWKLWPLLIVYLGFHFIKHQGSHTRRWKNRRHYHHYHHYDRWDDWWGIHDDPSKDADMEEEKAEGQNSHRSGHYTNKDHRSFFGVGDYEYNEENWKVEPMYLKNLAGDFYLDFTKAFIPEKETPVSIKALAGDIRIVIPENIAFRVDADVKAGEIDIIGQSIDGINRSMSFQTDDYEHATRKLDFFLTLKAGSIRVDQV